MPGPLATPLYPGDRVRRNTVLFLKTQVALFVGSTWNLEGCSLGIYMRRALGPGVGEICNVITLCTHPTSGKARDAVVRQSWAQRQDVV